jgi:hypothetical protein
MDALYEDIITALQAAKAIGMTQAKVGDSDVSERKAREMFGTKTVRRYRELFGFPQRTSGAANSRRRYQLAKLYELQAADEMTANVVRFEQKVRRQQQIIDTIKNKAI